jgi:hypothetical protein
MSQAGCLQRLRVTPLLLVAVAVAVAVALVAWDVCSNLPTWQELQ